MIYTIEKANLISKQLRKFTNGYTHHIVGHYANIDFWMNEVTDALKVIDNHRHRFDDMYNAQKIWIDDHEVVVHEYCPICRGKCEFSDGKPTLPEFRFKSELADAKKNLVDAAYYFLVRCFRVGLLTREDLKNKCDLIGASIDPNDLKK